MGSKITVLIEYSPISLFYSINPFLESSYNSFFHFTCDYNWCLQKDHNKELIIIRYFEGKKSNNDLLPLHLLQKLRDKYESILFFDDTDSTGKNHFESLDYVDFYLKKQILKDKNRYKDQLYGSNIISDFYHKTFSISDDVVRNRVPLLDKDLDRLSVSWNLGAGLCTLNFKYKSLAANINKIVNRPRTTISLLKMLTQKQPVTNTKKFDVHARFSFHQRPTINYQRELFFDILKNKDNVLLGKVDQHQYDYELRNSKIIISPFGWGEICYRDFEAVFNHSLLIKPDMSHVETWPDIYTPYETYVPVKWDGSDLLEKIDYYLANEAELKRISENAYAYLRAILNKNQLDHKVEQLLNLYEKPSS